MDSAVFVELLVRECLGADVLAKSVLEGLSLFRFGQGDGGGGLHVPAHAALELAAGVFARLVFEEVLLGAQLSDGWGH